MPVVTVVMCALCRTFVQVPVGFSPIAIVTSLPGLQNTPLQLSPGVLAGIFQCSITVWNDLAIKTLNPNLLCAHMPSCMASQQCSPLQSVPILAVLISRLCPGMRSHVLSNTHEHQKFGAHAWPDHSVISRLVAYTGCPARPSSRWASRT
jgi:hypothetical protein